MNTRTSLLRQIENPSLSPDQLAQLRCQLAKELEEAGDFEAARKAMGELWQGVGERPKVADLSEHTAAEVSLRAGALSAWIGSNNQIEGAQETAKNLIGESIRLFEALQETEKVAEAYIDLAVCYWRAGAYDEARVTLQESLSRLAGRDSELLMRALLNSTIIEISASHYNDALHILGSAAPLFEASNNHALKGKFNMNLAIVLNNLSAGERREEYKDRALVEYAAASYHFEQARYTRFRAYTENNLGFLLFTLARFNEAHSNLDRARRLFTTLKDPGCIAQVDETRARVLIAQHRYSEAERTARASVHTLEKGGQQSLLAEALTTHGTALARLGRYDESRFTLQRAIEVAHQAGALNDAGMAALTIIEELGDRITLDEMLSIYGLADHLLNDTQHPQTLNRLRQAAKHVITAWLRYGSTASQREPRTPTFVYRSDPIAALLREAKRIAGTYEPVLITGEVGTGKETLARLIHKWSGLIGEFVTVNCSALTETLNESQIFGHQKGLSTDTVESSSQGAVSRAAGRTLFLEEIDELSTSNQGKLLRLIDRDEAHSVEASTLEQVKVRIIAATRSNLQEDVIWELFRKDLYYRLNAFELHIPPLRERPEDIPPLAEHFIKEAFERYGQRVTFTPEAIEAMRQLPLRGNARELRALIERTMLTAPLGAAITRDAVETFVLLQTEPSDLADVWKGCSLSEEVRRYEGNLESPVQNFGRFYDEIFMDNSRKYKSGLGVEFDDYYGKRLKEEFGHLKLSQVTPAMIERFLLKLAETKTKYDRMFSPVTIRMHYERLNRVYTCARRERVFTGESPCRLVNPEILKNFPTWLPRERWLNQHDEKEEERLFEELSPTIATISHIILHTGLRPPKEILRMEKEHVNLTDRVKRFRGDKTYMIPPHSIFVANGKDGTKRMVPLNQTAERIFEMLCGDETTGRWLFSKDGKPIGSIKKGWQAACARAGIDDLRPYDLRHSFATRLVERNVHILIISELLGHAQPVSGFGYASRITPGYAHATWDAMRRAVDSLQYAPVETQIEQKSSKSRANESENEAQIKGVKVG